MTAVGGFDWKTMVAEGKEAVLAKKALEGVKWLHL